MMNQNKTQKVFIQFTYCPLCRTNHKKGKKHVLTTRHQEIVTNIVKKFSRKIAEAKKTVDKPVVENQNWPDSGRKFWCYFCQDDIEYHKIKSTNMGDCVVENGGMLEHILREDHVTNTTTFLKENRVDMKRTSEFVLPSQEYIKFLENLEKAVSLFFKNKAQLLNQMSSHIRVQSNIQRQIVASALLEQSKQQHEKQKYVPGMTQTGNKSSHFEDVQRKKTDQAFGEGLTLIDRSKEDDTLGNIFTNAVPPWMTSDAEDVKDTGQIGPTMGDLDKHRKLEKKAKLPATRVGARFDRSTDQSEAWMPSFGGVWHHTRRTDSVKQFQRRQFGKQQHFWAKTVPSSFLQTLSVPGKVQLPDKCLNNPGDAEVHSPFKIPKTTATAPAPWNRYITSTDNSRVPVQTSSSSLHPLSSSQAEHRFHSPNQVHDGHISQSRTLGSVDADIHGEAFSFQLQVKPYVSKRKRKVAATNFDSAPKLDYVSSSLHFCNEQHYQAYSINHSGPSTNLSMHQVPNNYFNGNQVCSSFTQGLSTCVQANSNFNQLSAPPSKGFPVPLPSANNQHLLPRLISTPLLQKQNKKT